MSLIAYEVLTVQPDFSEVPQIGIEDDRDLVQSPGGRAFAAWADRTDRVARFAFQTHTAEEWRILREFFDRLGGRAVAFYLPSWQHDFELAEDAPAGGSQLRLAGHWYVDNVTENRPDTLGRVIFTLNHLGQFSAHLVTSFGEDGADDVVGLYEPITYPLEAGRTMVGFCYLARLTDDTVDSEHLSVDHARMVVGFRNITHTRRVTQTESAEGPLVGTMNANEDIVATDADPLFFETRATTATGPLIYGVQQTDNFDATWNAAVSGNAIELTSPLGDQFLTALYNGTSIPKHIALAFDAASREVIAWDLENGSSRVGWRDPEGAATRRTFTGISPVLYNTFAIDSTVAAGDATVAVFYLKPQDATIYCRLLAEDFATEHRYCVSPLAPLRLFRARRNEGRLELVGIDTGHRRARWRSFPYLTPIPKQLAITTIQDFSGSYTEITVRAAGADSAVNTLNAVGGEYAEIRVYRDGGSQGKGLVYFDGSVAGAYTEIRVTAQALQQPSIHTWDGVASGDYVLVRKTGAGQDSATVTLQTIAGTYAP